MQSEKTTRHQAILALIRRESVSSQALLQTRLDQQGISVTQATLSRDLRELGVVRQILRDGSYRYAETTAPAIFPILSCRSSGNLLVLKTEAGAAPRIAYRIDELRLPEILGTVAGEDTLLIVIEESQAAAAVEKRVRQALGGWNS